jgi:short-subunit dehydrogenase
MTSKRVRTDPVAGRLREGGTALITGGSSGIGLAFARAFLRSRMNVILLARSLPRLQDAEKSLAGLPGKVALVPADVSSIHSLRIADQSVGRASEEIDVLVNCAGIVKPGLLADLEDADIAAQIQVTLLGLILSTRVFLNRIPRGGTIINISSAAAVFGIAGESVYVASKQGIVGFSRSLRRELLCRRIGVHVVFPADVDTPQYRQERLDMPPWMREEGVRPKLRSPDDLVKSVLRHVRMRRFLIYPDAMTALGGFLTQYTPGLATILIDNLSPHPR